MNKSDLERRITKLENAAHGLPMMVLWGDWDNPELFYTDSDREGEAITWQAAEAKYGQDYQIIKVTYTKDKGRHD